MHFNIQTGSGITQNRQGTMTEINIGVETALWKIPKFSFYQAV